MRAFIALCLAFSLAPNAAAQEPLERRRHAEAVRHYEAGQEHMKDESFEEAAREFSQATRLDPLFVLAHYSLGQAYMALRRYADAVRAYLDCRDVLERQASLSQHERAALDRERRDQIHELQNMIRIFRQAASARGQPEPHEVILLEQRIHVLESGSLKDANEVFRVPAELSLALGSAYFRSGRLEDAEREYRAAIKVNPKLGEAHNNLAVVLMMRGLLDEAEKEMKAAEKGGYTVSPRFKDDLKRAKAAAPPP